MAKKTTESQNATSQSLLSILRTDAELKELAVGIIDGKYFSTIGMPESDFHFLSVIFMPLAFMNEELVNQVREDDPVVFYADMSHRLQRSVNGYPIFQEVGMILRSEWKRFVTLYNEYSNLKREYLDKKNQTSS